MVPARPPGETVLQQTYTLEDTMARFITRIADLCRHRAAEELFLRRFRMMPAGDRRTWSKQQRENPDRSHANTGDHYPR